MIAIDLGSNTLRVIQVDCDSGRVMAAFEKMVKTADGLTRTGRVDERAVERVAQAIREAKEQIDFSSDEIRAVTTEALRRADNTEEVLAAIKEETGVQFEVISGEEEARLTLLATEYRLKHLDYDTEAFLLVDIGGGSTELIFRYPDKVLTRSFPVGIVTIAQHYASMEAIEAALPDEMAAMQTYTRERYRREGRIETFVATAGTPTTVAALKLGQNYATYDPEKINGTSLSVSDLSDALRLLLSTSDQEREKLVGVGRSDLIAAGILIFKRLFTIAEMEACIVIDDGLREGVALQGCQDAMTEAKSARF